MAKPKGVDKVGWGSSTYGGVHEIHAEMDINQKANRIRGMETYSHGHVPRQIGLASVARGKGRVYFLYSHSQVSNGGHAYCPPAFVGFTRAEMESITTWMLRELSQPE